MTDSDRPCTDDLVELWLAGPGPQARPESTQRNYRRAFDLWQAFLVRQCGHTHLWNATPAQVRAWQDELRQAGRRPATVNQILSSVSSFYEFVRSESLAPEAFAENPIRGHVYRDLIEPYAAARALTVAEYRRLIQWLEAHSTSLQRLRAHALIRTFLHTGWRASELLAMRAGDLRPSHGVHGAFRFHCSLSEGHEFTDLLPTDCAEVLLAFLSKAGRPLSTLPSGAYIWIPVRSCNLSGFGTTLTGDEPISVRTAQRVVRTHLRLAGIEHAHTIRLHDLRHTHASLLYASGASAAEIHKRLRHAHKQSTERYMRSLIAQEEVDSHSMAFASLRHEHAPPALRKR